MRKVADGQSSLVVNKQKDSKTVGSYEVIYTASLKDYPTKRKFVLDDPIKVTIVEPASDSNYIVNVMPEWL